MEINGVINVYKEAGYTSHDVVAKLRGIFHQKKIGHTGTLDPQAEGVLPVCLGKATKLCDLLADHDKVYEAVVHLGITTDTQDMTGAVLAEQNVQVTEEEVRFCIASFEGEQMQIPPMYSALKVGGRKLYELAREGKEVERKPRKVHFYQIEVLKIEFPLVSIRVHCSKGTYIRTLCHDIGENLGCGACMEKLVRTRVERFELTDARKLCQIEEYVRREQFSQIIVPLDQMFDRYPAIYTSENGDRLVHNGNAFPESVLQGNLQDDMHCADGIDRIDSAGNTGKTDSTKGKQFRVYDSRHRFVGIFREKGEVFSPVKMFYTVD